MDDVIKTSKSLFEVCVKVFGYGNKSSYNKVRKYILNNNIDISHFSQNPSNIKRIKYPKIKKKCPVCGKIFETKKGHKKEKTVCSRGCSNTYFRSGINNPNYKEDDELNGIASYTLICFRYHDKKCVYCGEDKIVEVHHYDGNRSNNKPINLVPLCPTHHRYWHSKYKYIVKDVVDIYVNNFNIE